MSKNKGLEVASTLMRGDCLFYVYSIGYGTYEESCYVQYAHDKKMTNDILMGFVRECMFEVLDTVAGVYRNDTFNLHMHIGENGPNMSEIMEHPAFEKALKSRGFQRVRFVAEANIFGWASAINPDDWGKQNDKETIDTATYLKDKCDEAGIYVEEVEVEQDVSKVVFEAKLDDEEKKKLEKMMKTYYRLGRK